MSLQDIAEAIGIQTNLLETPECEPLRILLEAAVPAHITLHISDGMLRSFDIRMCHRVTTPRPATFPGHVGSVSFHVLNDGTIREFEIKSVAHFPTSTTS